MGVVSGIDRTQRRFTVFGFPLAVVYKFFDDQGTNLAAALTYYAFVAIFPLLLLASSIFGFFLQGNQKLQDAVLNSALSQFPIIGEQLGRPEGLQGSTGAVIVGSVAALYGAMGLGTCIQNVMATVWGIPRNSRPNPFLLRVKSLLLLMFAGIAVIGVSVVSALGSNTEVFGSNINMLIRVVIALVSVVVVGLFLTVLFRFAAARSHAISRAAPGAFTVAVLWQALQYFGAVYATHVLTGPSTLNKTFGLVLGLVALIFLAAIMLVLGTEVNAVLARRLWPRALLSPFTDNLDLTEADRRAFAMYAQMQRRKGFETVVVRFEGRDGGTHEIELPSDGQRSIVRELTPPHGIPAIAPSASAAAGASDAPGSVEPTDPAPWPRAARTADEA